MKIENLTADLEFYRELKSRLEEALLEGFSAGSFYRGKNGQIS